MTYEHDIHISVASVGNIFAYSAMFSEMLRKQKRIPVFP